jgi:hypothetical protein
MALAYTADTLESIQTEKNAANNKRRPLELLISLGLLIKFFLSELRNSSRPFFTASILIKSIEC